MQGTFMKSCCAAAFAAAAFDAASTARGVRLVMLRRDDAESRGREVGVPPKEDATVLVDRRWWEEEKEWALSVEKPREKLRPDADADDRVSVRRALPVSVLVLAVACGGV